MNPIKNKKDLETSIDEIRKQIEKLANNEKELKEMGQNGYNFVTKKANWKNISIDFANFLIEDLR